MKLKRGMTLIEVMVALAIFAIAGSAILKATGDHIGSVGQIEEITMATWVANNQLTRVHLDDTWPPRNNQRGSTELAGRTWYWQQTVTQTNDEDLRSIEINVGLAEDFSDQITGVVSFVANPRKASN
jgi:general secretion pathway protein I